MLGLFEQIYRGATRLRNFAYDRRLIPQYRSCLPVISVGNLTTGGSGKTPFCLFLVERLLELGEKPVVILRGYGGRTAGPKRIEEHDLAAEVGDEALLYKKAYSSRVEVVVAARRVAGARFVEQHKLGSVIILDDGFQHRRIKRDLNILLVDNNQVRKNGPLDKQRLLPLGRLREIPAEAMKRVDITVSVERLYDNTATTNPIFENIEQLKPHFDAYLRPVCFYQLKSQQRFPAEEFRGRGIIATTAIAQNEAFFNKLRDMGLELRHTFSYEDHHLYTGDELDKILAIAANEDLPVVCTEKDAVKLKVFNRDKERFYILKSKIELLNGEQDRLLNELVLGAVNKRVSSNQEKSEKLNGRRAEANSSSRR